MPIRIDNELPAKQRLEIENIFVMSNMRADTQDIRPLKILILNLMPTKLETETQLLRLLSNSPLQVDVEFLQVATHEAKNVSKSHMEKFYETYDDVKDRKYDGMIITGAPVEQMEFLLYISYLLGSASRSLLSLWYKEISDQEKDFWHLSAQKS